MRLRVLHETHFSYSTAIHGVAMEARLRPCNDDHQFCQRYRLSISPKATVEEYSTFADLPVAYWTILKTTDVDIVSESIVDVHERPLVAVEVPPFALDLVTLFPYLDTTPLTRPSNQIETFAAQFSKLAAEDWY